MKTIVIGTNHAGTTAVRTLKRLDPKMEIKTFDKGNAISFLGCGIALWVQDEIVDPQGLFYASPEILKSEGIDVNMKHEWISIDNKKKTVTFLNLETNKEIVESYDKLIVATGTWPRKPEIEGINLKNIQICKNYDHAIEIKKANNNKKIKNVAVIGAGYIGIELVDAFVKSKKKVTLIDISDSIMPNYYDKEFTNQIQKEMKNANVSLELSRTVTKFLGSNNIVNCIELNEGTKIDTDYVVYCAGVVPQTKKLVNIVDLDKNGAIITDMYCRSSDENIYAIGDCAQVYNNAIKQNMQIALATTAVRTGIIAALNIVNKNNTKQMGFTGANGIDVFNWKMAATGISETVARNLNIDYEVKIFEDNDRPEFMPTVEKVKLKLIWNKKTRAIIGAQIASKNNHTEVIYMLALCIQKEVKIDEIPLIDIFFLPHFNKPYNYITLAGLDILGLNYFKK